MADAESTRMPAPNATVEPNRPRRIQRKRTRGWKMPPNTVYVGRPTKWGNPFNWRTYRRYWHDCEGELSRASDASLRHSAVTDFASCVKYRVFDLDYPSHEEIRRELAGKNLACWCPLDCRCHADILLEIANGGAE